ncbi:MAG: plasmid pRiA4b ORF-3 family protein [Nitrospinae bacterium]|nr:plasmid pRiA4b ORF-3 family protein [Nitrospinota bacterium]
MTEKGIPLKTIYQVKITLRGIKPPIWRRFQVESNVTLGRFHKIIQAVMGWWDGHLHQFRVGNTCYTNLDPEEDLERFDDARDEDEAKLSSVMNQTRKKIIYEYDFGDGWEHDILLEKVIKSKELVRYPTCIAGKRSCPPEDCGGVWGYQNLLDVLKNPNHPEYKEMREWVPEWFDSEEFELDEVNEALRALTA